VPLVALDEEHFVHRGVLLKLLEAGDKARITESSSRIVVDQKATVHRGVDGL